MCQSLGQAVYVHVFIEGLSAENDAWQGPSVSIDTACSSSLVGTHLAATSFLSSDCPRALVCGVNLTMRAETTAILSKAGMLAQVTPKCYLLADLITALSTQLNPGTASVWARRWNMVTYLPEGKGAASTLDHQAKQCGTGVCRTGAARPWTRRQMATCAERAALCTCSKPSSPTSLRRLT